MLASTVQKLVEINLDFYNRIGPLWNQNPDYFWLGWESFLPDLKGFVKNKKIIRVLDLGAGNCRFLNFLAQNLELEIEYTALDFSSKMLHKIDYQKSFNLKKVELIQVDLLKPNWEQNLTLKKFDLITAFGLLHHSPGFENRKSLIKNCFNLVEENGLFIFTIWNFLNVPRLKKRVVWPNYQKDDYALQKFKLNKEDLEKGDYLLDWVKKDLGYRYAHFLTDEEVKELLDLKFEIVTNFLADGKTRNRNSYFITKKVSNNHSNFLNP